MAASIDTAGAVYTATTGGTTTKTFELPANVEEGRKLIVILFQTSNNRVTVAPAMLGGATTLFTLIGQATETLLEPFWYTYTIEAADVGETTATFTGNGTAEYVVMAAWIGDVDLASGTTNNVSPVGASGNNVQFGMLNSVDTLDTDEKLFVMFAMQSRPDTGAGPVNEAGADFDFNAWDDIDGDGTIGAPLIPVGTIGWAYLVSTDQVFYPNETAGSPSPVYRQTLNNGDTIGMATWFDTQDDANWPYGGGEPEPPPVDPPAAESGGASDADLVGTRSHGARRRIVDPLDNRRKYRQQF